MPANNIISREQTEALIREQVVPEIFQKAPAKSTFMALARKLPNMTSKQTRIRVLDVLPVAYWVNGDTGYKQTSEQAWDNVYLTAAELAVIVPIPEAVLDDAEFDIMGEVTPRVISAIGKRVDEAVIFGKGKPSEWGADIITRARQAGNNVADGADLYGRLLAENSVFDKVEQYGYAVNGIIASRSMRSKLRGLRDDNGQPIYNTNMQGATTYALDGAPLYFPDNNCFDKTIAQLIAGDFSQAVYAIRQDITVKIIDQGVIQDPSNGNIIYNLPQQDMIALRVVFRLGWALPNPATELDDRTGCPFAYLEPASPVTTQAVTFTVKDGSNNAIEGAVVDVEGARLKTNVSGQAVFNLRAGTYGCKVTCKGFKTTTDSVTVSGSSVSKNITLTANS